MKILGSDIKLFFEADWSLVVGRPELNLYIEEGGVFDAAGREVDTDSLEGSVKYGLSGVVMSEGDEADKDFSISLESVYRKWAKGRDSTTVVVTVPIKDLEALKAVCKEHGWKNRA